MFCNKRKILFINVPRTASTSIKNFFFSAKRSQYAHSFTATQDGTPAKLHEITENTFSVIRTVTKSYTANGEPEWYIKCDLGLADHHTIRDHESKISSKDLRKAFKFCVLREPHERLLSYYSNKPLSYWEANPLPNIYERKPFKLSTKGNPHTRLSEDFNTWVSHIYEPIMKVRTEIYANKLNQNIYHHYLTNRRGEIDIDYFLDFNNLQNDIDLMYKRYHKKADKALKRAKPPKELQLLNRGKRLGVSYKDVFNEESLEIFEKYNKKDIELYSLERSKQKARRRS